MDKETSPIKSLTDLEYVANNAIKEALRKLSDEDLLKITESIGNVGGGRSWQIVNYAAMELRGRLAKTIEHEAG